MKIGQGQTVTSPTKQGGIVAIYYLGTTIGTLCGGAVSDRYGRIRAVVLGCFWAIFGGALQVKDANRSIVPRRAGNDLPLILDRLLP
jgi:MFS family permease